MRETLYNQRFGDIYFSPEDGLAETRHVFLEGNNLPARWKGRQGFTIAETGFGTGLNFLAAWELFEQTADEGQVLDYVSFEMFPLSPTEIRQMLAEVISGAFSTYLDELLDHYPIRASGFHRVVLAGGRVRLTLVFDDVNRALPELEAPQGVDAWFLDGFAPAKNPQMWSPALFSEMARLSREGTTVATFTAAGAVRRGLAEAGFAVEKEAGFGRKRDMTVGCFTKQRKPKQARNNAGRIAIIGGGLAGTACAYVLRQQGLKPVIFERAASLAAGASGNALGLYNPRFTAQRCPESEFYSASFATVNDTLRHIASDKEIAFNPCGALHLINSPEKQKRFLSLRDNWGWHEDHLRLLGAADASAQAGVTLAHDALFLPDSGSVSPAALCAAYAEDTEIRLNMPVACLEPGAVNGEAFDAIIVACGYAVRELAGLSWLPLHTVRGQISIVAPGAISAALRCHLCYGGYVSAGGVHVVGATFQKWLDDTIVKEEDHRENLAKLDGNVPALADGMRVIGGRAALRTASRDHFPVIGVARDDQGCEIPGLYVSLAHGSHGILSSLAGAHLIADMILNAPRSLPRQSIGMLDGGRFIKREKRQEQR